MWKVFYKKWLTTQIEREHHQNESKLILIGKPKIDNDNNDNNRKLLVGPSSLGQTYLMLKILSRTPPDRDTYKFTKPTPEQFSFSKIKIKEKSDEIKPPDEYQNAIIVFHDTLG